MSLFEAVKNKLFQPEEFFPLPDIYKTLAYYLIKDDYIISKCGRILFFNENSVSIVSKDKQGITLVVYPNSVNTEEETPTPINFNPSKMAEYDKAFWSGIQLKLISILTPIG